MSETVHPLTVWGHGLALILYSVLALHLWRQVRTWTASRRAGRAAFAGACLTAAWAGMGWLVVEGWALLWPTLLLDVGRYGAWLSFLVLLLDQGLQGKRGQSGRHWLTLAAIGLPSAVALGVVLLPWMGTGLFKPGLSALFLGMMLLAVFGLLLIEQLIRNLPKDGAWNAKPVCLGLAGTFLFDLYLFSQAALFGGIDPDALSVRALLHAAFMPLMLLSASRSANWVGKMRVSHQVVFHSATLLLVGGYLLFMAAVGYYVRYFDSEWGRALQLALLFVSGVSLLALLLSGSLRARLRVWLGKHFFRYRYDYRDEWLRFTQTLSSQGGPQDMGLHVIRGMADLLESSAGALWMRRPEDLHYRQVARWNCPNTAQVEPADSPLMSFMVKTGWVVSLPEHAQAPQRYDSIQLPTWLGEQPGAWLIAPLWVGDFLLGFVVVSGPRGQTDLNWEVHDLLKTAGRQAASYLAQMQATESLLEARKFEAFSKMSAFVVHDLKNIVTQLSLMMKNAQRHGTNPAFQADMLMTVDNALDRMRQLMLQLREGTTSVGNAVGVDLEQIVDTVRAGVLKRGRDLELQVEPRVATRGHAERLERVLGHLVNNALDATRADQRVWLKVDRYGSHARVEVGDNGAGMAQSFVQERLFRPFQSTKPAGMGIGAYESFQYVQELGGRVSVDTQEGHGTVITLLLPLIERFSTSDLQELGEA